MCDVGISAPLNEAWLRSLGVAEVFGGEFEADLADAARRLQRGDPAGPPPADTPRPLAKLQFIQPDRAGLPPLSRYATLRLADGTTPKGFLVEPEGLKGASAISHFGGWRAYIASLSS